MVAHWWLIFPEVVSHQLEEQAIRFAEQMQDNKPGTEEKWNIIVDGPESAGRAEFWNARRGAVPYANIITHNNQGALVPQIKVEDIPSGNAENALDVFRANSPSNWYFCETDLNCGFRDSAARAISANTVTPDRRPGSRDIAW